MSACRNLCDVQSWRQCLLLALLLLCGIGTANPAAQADCGEAALTQQSMHSRAAGGEVRYRVYLPPCYAATAAPYPLLMLLHGSNADAEQWARLGFLDALTAAIHSGAAAPMLVVMPDGGARANENRFGARGYDAVLLELLEHSHAAYRTDGRQAVGGISRGGFWAYQVGLRFAETFTAIGGHSPFFDPQHVPPPHNPLSLTASLPAESAPKLWLDRGTRDHAADGIERMRLALEKQGAAYEYRVYAGGSHDERSWAAQIDDYLAFYAQAFAAESQPSPAEPAAAPPQVELWLPAVGFPALQTSLSAAALDALLAGQHNPRLLLSAAAADRLRQRGFDLHAETRITASDRLEYQLWREKDSFTLLPFDALQPRLRPLWVDGRAVVEQLARYPLVFESGAPNFTAERLTRITLSGTTALARQTLTALDAIGIEAAAGGIADYVRAVDFFHITNEASIAPGCPLHSPDVLGGSSSLCMKRGHLALFERLDVDVADLSGNHINDFGYAAFEATLDELTRLGIAPVGGGRSPQAARSALVLQHNHSRIGWIACNRAGPYYALANADAAALGGVRPGAAYCDDEWLRDALPLLAAEVDVVLVTVQYHEFESYQPSPQQRFDYRRLAEWGADVVIGTAEHKPMTFEFYQTRRGETAWIHYGLGNLFFDQPFWGNRRFFMDTLYIYDGRLVMVELFPGIIEQQARPTRLLDEEQFNFLHFIFVQQNGF